MFYFTLSLLWLQQARSCVHSKLKLLYLWQFSSSSCAQRLLVLLMKSHNRYKCEWCVFILYVHLELGLMECITRTMEGCDSKGKDAEHCC